MQLPIIKNNIIAHQVIIWPLDIPFYYMLVFIKLK